MLTQAIVERFVNQQLTSVAVQLNSARLQFVKYPLSTAGKFEDKIVVEIEHGFDCESARGKILVLQRNGVELFRESASSLIQFVQFVALVVISASQTPSGDLDLKFETGSTLRIIASDTGFGGFHVHAAAL